MRTRILAVGGLFLLAACTAPAGGDANPAVPTIGTSTAAPSNVAEPTSAPGTAPDASASALIGQPPAPPQPPGQAPEPAANPAECKAAELKLGVIGGDSGGGTTYRQLSFTNAGSRNCVIQGFPGVSYVAGDDGHQVGPAAVRVGTKGSPITLAPGNSANATVGFVQVRNYDASACKPTSVRGLRVYPPHETASVFVPLDGTGCAANPPGQQLTVKTIEKA